MHEEEEKIKAGILFHPEDGELCAMKRRIHNRNVDYNHTYEDETDKRAAILREILGEFGMGGFIQGPIALHYGIQTKIGQNVLLRESGRGAPCCRYLSIPVDGTGIYVK